MMLRTILAAVDDSPSSGIAQAIAVELGTRHHSRVAAVGIVDSPWITRPEPVPVGGMAYKISREEHELREAATRIHAALDRFRALAAAANLPCDVVQRNGAPTEVVEREATTRDLIVIGRETSAHFRADAGEISETAGALVRRSPRPVLLTPVHDVSLRRVLVTFDGSAASSRALHIFALLGLATGREVQVLSVHPEVATAERLANEAADLLRLHGSTRLHAVGIGTTVHPAEIILSQNKAFEAGVIAMGAFGHRGMREVFFGSTTRRLLEDASAALFLHH